MTHKKYSIGKPLIASLIILGSSLEAKTISVDTYPEKIDSTYVDKFGMPRCVDGTKDSVLFFWDEKDHYVRDVQAITLSQLNSKSEYPTDTCSRWQDIVERIGIFGKKKLEANAKSFAGVDFDERTISALVQLQSGASVYLPNSNVKDFVDTHKITKIDQELNRQLTSYYGHGFASLVYKQVLDSIPKNKIFLDQVSAYAKSLSQNYQKAEIAERFKNRTAVFITGYMYDPVANNRTKDISDFFTSHGIDYKQIVPKPMGSVRENAAYIAQELRALLAMNKNLILFAISKGVPEVFGALS